jgi:hypothetical protein
MNKTNHLPIHHIKTHGWILVVFTLMILILTILLADPIII